jgi:CheY-like chemotaxis protein
VRAATPLTSSEQAKVSDREPDRGVHHFAAVPKHPWIMIVDDDADMQGLLGELLENEGYEVDIASNGVEAINMLEGSVRPCAVLVDLIMPGVVGQELIEYLRSDEKLASIPLAIVSGSPQLAPEGYPVFPKPVQPQALLEFIKRQC